MKQPYRPVRRRPLQAPPQTPTTSRFPYRDNASRQREDYQLLDDAVACLMEHFDTVQVVATRHANDGTCFAARGAGNHYARLGSVREWFTRDNEETRDMIRQSSRGGGDTFSPTE